MLIAFEGPDNTGKSTSAEKLDCIQIPVYNLTKELYEESLANINSGEKGLVHTFDRIDWLTHMAYRLALPDKEWNDERVRTVFAAPDLHLVFKLHNLSSVPLNDQEEGYADGQPTKVNDMYYHLSNMFVHINEVRNFSLFKTITIMEVIKDDLTGEFHQRVTDFSSPVYPWGTRQAALVKDEQGLLELLQEESRRR